MGSRASPANAYVYKLIPINYKLVSKGDYFGICKSGIRTRALAHAEHDSDGGEGADKHGRKRDYSGRAQKAPSKAGEPQHAEGDTRLPGQEQQNSLRPARHNVDAQPQNGKIHEATRSRHERFVRIRFSPEAAETYKHLKERAATFKFDRAILKSIDYKCDLIATNFQYGKSVGKDKIP